MSCPWIRFVHVAFRSSRSALGLGLVGVGSLLLAATACGGDSTDNPGGGVSGSPAGTAGSPGSVGGNATGGSGAASGAGGGGGSTAAGGGGGVPGLPMDASGWRNVRIGGGGYVTGLVFHPTAAGLLYARTDMGGLYRYDATRSEWVPLLDWIGRTHAHHYGILSVALDAQDPSKVYAMAGTNTDPSWAGKGALLRSKDGGATWEQIDLQGAAVGGLAGVYVGANEEGRGAGERLVVDPNSGTTLFMGPTKAGLWNSVDSGSTWTQVIATGLERVHPPAHGN